MSSRIRYALLLLPLGLLFLFARPAQRGTPATPPANDDVTMRVTFGYLRLAPKPYDGSVTASGGRIRKIDLWRGLQQDSVSGDSWKLSVRRLMFENQPDHPNSIPAGSGPVMNIVPAAVIVTVDRSATSLAFKTAQGDFTVALRDVLWGKVLHYLDGDVVVERVPAALPVSESAEENDYPSIALTRSGAVWTAWQGYQNEGDHIYARQLGGPVMRLTDTKGDLFRTSVAEDSAGRIHVAWSERHEIEWNIFERVWDGSNWSPRRQITASTTSPNFYHKLVNANGTLRMVWVGHENGDSYLYTSALETSGWSAPQRIGGPNVWMPDAAADRQGNLYVAWDSYQNGNYDIFFRRIAANGTPDPIEQVTKSPRFEAHASVAVDGQGRPWLAWDESGANWGKDWNHEDQDRSTVLYSDRTIQVVVKDGGSWKQAGDFINAVNERLRRYWQLPHLAADGAGRIWALFQIRTSSANSREDYWCAGGLWDLYLTSFDNGVWQPAAFVPNSTARNEPPFQIAGGADRVWMVWPTDGRKLVNANSNYQAPTVVKYDIFAAQAAAGAPATIAGLQPFIERPARPQIMHPNEKQDVVRIRGYRATASGKSYRIMRGDFHRHTDISNDGSGDGSLEDFYRYMIDVAAMDTGIVTDHNMGGDVEYNWWRTEKSYDLFRIPTRYTPLFGYERSVNYPNGHRNVVFDHRGVHTLPVGMPENRGQVNSGSLIYPYLRQHRGICMEHSLATGQGTDYRDNDPVLEPLVEIYQGYHAAYEYSGAPRAEDDNRHLLIHGAYEPAGFWWNALAKGLKLGVQASSDHISTHCSYSLIYTPDDNRTNIVESMRARHAYAATDNIVLDVQAEGHIMGDEFTFSGQPRFHVHAIGTDQISHIDLIRNGDFVYSETPKKNEVEFDYQDKAPGNAWYYVRVMQLDGNLAWSSPIWIKR
jgi:hypothetical protein